jgi:probable ubiquitin carboxyl-terminal hydrolase 12
MKAFSSTEILDEDNPWYCPVCRCHQRARKSLSIWKCPSTLMVYLKRFLFHEMTSIKVDDPVKFPIDSLDMSKYSQDLEDTGDQIYHLQAFVCHSGGEFVSFCFKTLLKQSN